MQLKIITSPLALDLYGFSGAVINHNYGETGFKLMNRMWTVVKGMNLKNRGTNVWVYEPNMAMFAGVELESAPPRESLLENKKVELTHYAWWKHIGPYDQLKQVNANMRSQLESMNIQYQHPCLEIYGHHIDGKEPETEIVWAMFDLRTAPSYGIQTKIIDS